MMRESVIVSVAPELMHATPPWTGVSREGKSKTMRLAPALGVGALFCRLALGSASQGPVKYDRDR